MAQPRYKTVMNVLLRDIFQNKLKPGDRLPTERDYSKMMNVDRTSLRIALKQLETMEVLEIRQGDGIYVKNYLKNAGVDFLKMLFLQQEHDKEEIIIDEYLLDEIMEFWVDFLPLMLKVSLKRFTPRDMNNLIKIIEDQNRAINDRDAVKRSELEQLEFISEKTGNLLYVLLSNSTRPLRRKLIELFIDSFTDDELDRYIEVKRAILKTCIPGDAKYAVTVSESFKKVLSQYSDMMRKALHVTPQEERIINEFISRQHDEGMVDFHDYKVG